jgi:lyso-ornithine lipid O-acyltransferase
MLYPLGRLLRLIVAWVDFITLTALLYGITFLPRALWQAWYPRAFHYWCRVFVRAVDIDLRVMQNHAKPLPERYLLIANHPSAFEDIGIPALFDVYCLAKIEVKSWLIVGRISAAAGTLYVHRESKESRREAAQEIEHELQHGKNIALYPEGGCKGRRVWERFYYGVFDISLRTGIPIVPVFIHYEAQQDFEWGPNQTLIDKIKHFLTTDNNRANYYVFDAIDPSQFGKKEAYCAYVYGLYQQWQKKYLE